MSVRNGYKYYFLFLRESDKYYIYYNYDDNFAKEYYTKWSHTITATTKQIVMKRENKNGFQNNIQAFLNKISFLLKIFIYPSYIIWAVFWRETMVSQLNNSILIVGYIKTSKHFCKERKK